MKQTFDLKVIFEDSLFRKYFQQYIQYKQGLGFSYGHNTQYCLSRLNKQLIELNATKLNRATVEKLCERHQGEAPATQLKRISLLRHFAQFLNDMGIEAYIVPTNYNVKWIDTFAPYIFSHEQIKSIFKAADSIPPKKVSPYYHLVWPTFIRVLYGCGLRLSEALSLKVVDVDLAEGIVYIDKSKKGTSRYVPMSVTLSEYCGNYAKLMSIVSQTYFFPAPDGGRYGINTAYSRIKDIYEKASIPKLSNGLLPRIHDLRHTFCCHALDKMQDAGFDLYYALPILSTYIGHQGIRDTEQYLRLPTFQYSSIVDAEMTSLRGIIPEVDSHER